MIRYDISEGAGEGTREATKITYKQKRMGKESQRITRSWYNVWHQLHPVNYLHQAVH